MAQALEKVNVSKTEKNVFFAQKIVIVFQSSVCGEIQFSKKSSTKQKKQPHAFPQQVLVQQTPIISCSYYMPPRSGPHEVLNCREAAVPEKETKTLMEGARGYRAHLTKMKAQYQAFQMRCTSFVFFI